MQTMDDGKHDILPVAGAILDHARMPVMLPRQSDADMRRDGSTTVQTVPNPPSMSAEECTAHQDSQTGDGSTGWFNNERAVSQNSVSPDTMENRRRKWPERGKRPRLRGQDKSVAVVGRFLLVRSAGYAGSRRKGLLALFENSPMISMPFAPSIVAFRWFGICESWTAREKLGRPARVGGWDS
jgi:hypothetical protein